MSFAQDRDGLITPDFGPQQPYHAATDPDGLITPNFGPPQPYHAPTDPDGLITPDFGSGHAGAKSAPSHPSDADHPAAHFAR
jgi:hypothetical protein